MHSLCILGTGSCLGMWGLTSSGVVTVNVVNSVSNTAVGATASAALQTNVWTHIAQTFSVTNGTRLFINGALVATTSQCFIQVFFLGGAFEVFGRAKSPAHRAIEHIFKFFGRAKPNFGRAPPPGHPPG
jgi:hypothetical protein